MEYNIEDKIKILGLTDERVNFLSKLYVEEIDFYDGNNAIFRGEIINVDDVVGTTRGIGNITWLDMLEIQVHKNRNFDIYNSVKFDEVLLSNQLSDGVPLVVKKENKYYIHGNGLHRLTFAKCIGNKRALVGITDYK